MSCIVRSAESHQARFPEMIFRQSGAGVGAQALSFKVWWCVPCWSGGRELYLSVVEPPAVTGFITSLGILSFKVNDMELCFGFSASKSLGMKELPLPAFFCASTLPTPTFRIHKAMLSMILGQINQCDQRADLSKDSSRSRMHWTKNTSTTSLPADCHLAGTGGHLDTMRSEFHGLLWRLLGLHVQVDMGYTRCSPVPWHATRCFDCRLKEIIVGGQESNTSLEV